MKVTNRYDKHQADSQADRHTDRQTSRQLGRQTHRQTDRHRHRQTDRHTDRQTDTHTDRHTHTHTHRQTDRQTHRQTHTHTDRRQKDVTNFLVSNFQFSSSKSNGTVLPIKLFGEHSSRAVVEVVEHSSSALNIAPWRGRLKEGSSFI